MNKKTLGSSNIEISALGFGCWAIGGLFTLDGIPDGWGEVDDAESVRAIERALDLGVQLFDTSDAYGTGHSEEVLGRALQGRRQEAVIATKFGYTYDSTQRKLYTNYDVSPEYIRWACEQSMRRLGTDYIDLYQIHVGGISWEEMESAIAVLDQLKSKGWIRSYGWSSEDRVKLSAFAELSEGDAIQHPFNVLDQEASDIVELCERHHMTSINNAPLAMGLLSGKFQASSVLPANDVRGAEHKWVRYFKDGKPVPQFLQSLHAIAEILRSDGRSLVQGALSWIWGKSDATLPIPGLRTVKQVEEAAGALEHGPLRKAQMEEIEQILLSLAKTSA